MKRILILTASFGEGHNTAARNLRDALLERYPGSVAVVISDLYQKTNPRFNRLIQKGYLMAINRFTTIWRAVFSLLSVPGLLELSLPTLHSLRVALEEQIREFQPHAILSTYPVYSFLIDQIRRAQPGMRIPLITVVTDSTAINSAWFRCPSTSFVVADEASAGSLMEGGISKKDIQVLGFPVGLEFDQLEPLKADALPPWKILLLPPNRRHWTVNTLTRLLANPDFDITVLTGRMTGLRQALMESGFSGIPRVKILGWSDEMPQLLASHHVFAGKAGGAIVQESIAAGCPFVVCHVVPGQEEGNITLIRQSGIGCLAEGTPAHFTSAIEGAFADNAAVWREWKSNLTRVRKPSAAKAIADFIISQT